METRGELSTTCNPKIMSRCLSAPGYIHTSLPQEQAAKTSMVSEVRIPVIIREYGSTFYVGLARDVSPTNTNFRLTYLLTRLQVALYEDLAV